MSEGGSNCSVDRVPLRTASFVILSALVLVLGLVLNVALIRMGTRLLGNPFLDAGNRFGLNVLAGVAFVTSAAASVIACGVLRGRRTMVIASSALLAGAVPGVVALLFRLWVAG